MKGSRKHPSAPLLAHKRVGRVIILLGPQGSGKGTQAELLARRFHLFHLEVGRILRREARRHTPLGRRIDETINVRGKLFPFKPTMALLVRVLGRVPRRQGVLFDGTPRRIEEVRFWDRLLPELGRTFTAALFLTLTEAESIRRLGKRLLCMACGRNWIRGVDVPRMSTPCPACGGRLAQRPDDRPSAVRKRLAIFRRQTLPVIRHFARRGILHRVNGAQPIRGVFRDLMKELRR